MALSIVGPCCTCMYGVVDVCPLGTLPSKWVYVDMLSLLIFRVSYSMHVVPKKYNRLGGHSQQIKDMHAVASLNKHNCDFLVIINMANCTITGHGQMPLAKNNTTN